MLLFVLVILIFSGVSVARHLHHGAAAATARPLSYSVGLSSCTFVDFSRSTPDFASGTTLSSRTLPVQIRYPSLTKNPYAVPRSGAKVAKSDGPFGLIVFGGGYDLSPQVYEPLLDSWVKAGFVVVAPIFPETNPAAVAAAGHSQIGESDDINQPGDVAFVTRSVLEASAHPGPACPVLARLINASRLALAGQSDGGETVAALSYDSAYRQAGLHFRAAAVLSGQEFPTPSGMADPYSAQSHDPALLVVQSTTDQCNPPQYSTKLYDDIGQSDKWFLKLNHADHLPPYSGTDPAAFRVVSALTTRFFKLELSGEAPGANFRALADAHPSIASLSSGPAAPLLGSLSQVSAACYLGA